MIAHALAFLPELVLLGGALALFLVSLGQGQGAKARSIALGVAVATAVAAGVALGQRAVLFHGVYHVDALSQWVKLILSTGFVLATLLSGPLPDVRDDIRPEYQFLLALSVLGLLMLASAVELVTLVVALELSSFPLYLAVAMRRERPGQWLQMESAVKYLMFGVAANGIMFFGLGDLFGITGTTFLPVMAERLQGQAGSTLLVAALGLSFAGVLYKLAAAPFQFWTPDVYEGASNETAAWVASLPKLGAAVVLFRLVSLVPAAEPAIPLLLALLAGASMVYGNLLALAQRDFKRLLGFSGIAHAGYALVGFVAMNRAGFAASFYYLTGYVFMVLACFTVISRVSVEGHNVAIEDLAGLHRRSPLLAVTLLVGVFGLAGIPPLAGFIGKLSVFTAALERGHLPLVVFAVLNAAVAAYYYLSVVREVVFREAGDRPVIVLDTRTRVLCGLLILGIVALGVLPGRLMERLGSGVAAASEVLERR